MEALTAEETLRQLIERLTRCLTELEGAPHTEFTYGEKTAYVECLEWIQRWQEAAKNGLEGNVEKRFPLLDY